MTRNDFLNSRLKPSEFGNPLKGRDILPELVVGNLQLIGRIFGRLPFVRPDVKVFHVGTWGMI
jgi:hypothetical protein